jgi:hypothetical protein
MKQHIRNERAMKKFSRGAVCDAARDALAIRLSRCGMALANAVIHEIQRVAD